MVLLRSDHMRSYASILGQEGHFLRLFVFYCAV